MRIVSTNNIIKSKPIPDFVLENLDNVKYDDNIINNYDKVLSLLLGMFGMSSYTTNRSPYIFDYNEGWEKLLLYIENINYPQQTIREEYCFDNENAFVPNNINKFVELEVDFNFSILKPNLNIVKYNERDNKLYLFNTRILICFSDKQVIGLINGGFIIKI